VTYLHRQFSRDTALGSALRVPLRLIPRSATIPVLSGPNRGLRWLVEAGPHSCWLGFYEADEVNKFVGLIRRGSLVFDVGANAGYFSLAAARASGERGQVVAFEPLDKPARWLERHVAMNGLRNVRLERCAVADRVGKIRLEPRADNAQGQMSSSGSLSIDSKSLDHICDERQRMPNVMKIDVEGAEALVLRGATELLRKGRPSIMLETHTGTLRDECVSILSSFDYRFEPISPWPDHGPISGSFLALPT
jgi:FkbM family methyltransferase